MDPLKFQIIVIFITCILLLQIHEGRSLKCVICDGDQIGGDNCFKEVRKTCSAEWANPALFLTTFPQYSETGEPKDRVFWANNLTKYLRYKTIFQCVAFEINKRTYKYCMYREIDFCKLYRFKDPCEQCTQPLCNSEFYEAAALFRPNIVLYFLAMAIVILFNIKP